MRSKAPALFLVLILGAGAFGFAALYRLRLQQGDSFPVYSSLRADPLGLRVLHDSLAALPGLHVTRHLEPLEQLDPVSPRVILLAGVPPEDWDVTPRSLFNVLDRAVRSGSRLVIALQAKREVETSAQKTKRLAVEKESAKAKEKAGGKKAEKPSSPREETGEEDSDGGSVRLSQAWGIDVVAQFRLGDAERTSGAPANFPVELATRSDYYLSLSEGRPWRVLYRRGDAPVLAELPMGKGSIVVVNDSYFLSNEALQKQASVSLLAWLVGPYGEVEFEEGHLGLLDDPGVAALARRYGLAGAFFTLILLAALYAWRRSALFVPPAGEAPDVALAYNQTAGLEALLRRAVPPGELAKACIAEWRQTAREADIARVEAAVAANPSPGKDGGLSSYNAAVRALRRR